MAAPRVLVTGATGKTGGALAEELRARGYPVRAVVRRRDARVGRLDRLGVETVVADLHDPDQMTAALRDVQRVYYLPPIAPHGLHAAAAFAAAAQVTRPEAVVQMSQWLAQPAHPSIVTREMWLIERMFATLPGTLHIVLDPGMFADNFLRVLDFATLLRIYPVLMGESRSAPVATEDIARVAAELLADPARHAGRRYRPTGPALLSGREMAAVIARVLGHPVMPVDLPFWLFRKVARMTGVHPHEVMSFRDYIADHRAGAFSFEGGVTDVVEELTGRPAEPFETTVRRYAAMPFARATWRNRLAAMARFAAAPLYPGYDLERYQRHLALPVPPEPRLSARDPRWQAEHAGRMAAPPAGGTGDGRAPGHTGGPAALALA